MNTIKNLTIISVDDDVAHSTLIKRSLLKCGLSTDIVQLNSGQQALDYVFAQGNYEKRSRQQKLLILLDINMPGLNGIKVLETIKTSDVTRHIPVIMITTTDDPAEIDECFRLGCNAYLVKPVKQQEFVEKIQRLGQFLMLSHFPKFSK